jgi:hypothetical protein
VILMPSCSSNENNPFGSLNTSSTWNTTQRSVLDWVFHGDRTPRYNRSFFFPEFINDSLFIFEKSSLYNINFKIKKIIMRWVGLRLVAPSNRTLF